MSNFKSSLINDLATARLGQPGGFAKLDDNGLVPIGQLPAGSGEGGLSWVPQSFTPNSMNPFSNGLPQKLDANGNPNVYHFNSSGLITTDGTTVFAVQQNERLWYRTDTDSWYHEKNTPQYLGASTSNAGTAGIVPLAQQGQQNFVFKGDGSWGGAWGNLNASGGPIPDGKYLIDTATAIAITLDEAIGEVRLFDYKGLVATNNITVGTNAQTFTDASGTAVAGPYIINTNNEDITFVNNTGTNAFTVVKRMSGTNPTVQPLTYGRVRANLDLASTTHINTDPGTKIPFTISTYLSGMTDNAGSLIPSVSGRYRADWLCMASSTDFLADGIFYVVQNGVSVGQVSYNMNEASAVNQSAGFIDVDLVVGQEVSLHYRTRHTTTDGISWDRGSYFQLTQLPTGTIQLVENIVYEDNSAVLGSSVNVPPSSTNASNATDVMSFTIPSAGVWEIKYNIRATTPNQTATSVTGMVALITNNSNLTEASSEIAISRFQSGSTSGSGNSLTATGSGVTTITTTGAETFKLRAHHDGSANGTQSFNVQSDNNGRTKVSWVKKAGQLPAIMPTTINGGIAFGNGTALVQDAPNLFYDDTNKRLGIGTSSPSNNLTIQTGNASLKLAETNNNQNLWFYRFTNRAVIASSDAFELRTGSADGVNGAAIEIDNLGNITQLGATKITTGTNGLRLPITSASANVAGGAIGVDVNGDVVKIANPIIPTLVGSNGVIAGTAGLVPAPTLTDNTKFLKGDGTWATAGGATVPFVNGGIVFGDGTTQVQDATNFFVDNTNKRVGFGTNTPSERLDIVGSGAGDSSALKISNFGSGAGWGVRLSPLNNGGDYIRFDRADGNQVGRIYNSGATGDDLGLASQNDLVLGSSYTERMRILTNGNVGIGTNNPAAKLDVNNSANELLKLTGVKTTLKLNSNNDNPEFIFSRSGGVVGNFGRVDFKFDNTDAGGSINNVFNFEGTLKLPITSASTDQVGSPIGVNASGDVVKIATPPLPIEGVPYGVVLPFPQSVTIPANTWGGLASFHQAVPSTGLYNIFVVVRGYPTASGPTGLSIRIRKVLSATIVAGSGASQVRAGNSLLYTGAANINTQYPIPMFMAIGIPLTVGEDLIPELYSNGVPFLFADGGGPDSHFILQKVGN